MAEALESQKGLASVGGRNITDLRFADDIDGLAGVDDELRNLVKCFDQKGRLAGNMEIIAKSKTNDKYKRGFLSGVVFN